MCRAVRVSRSGFYQWQSRQARGTGETEVALAARVEAVFWRHSRRYGSRRVVAELKAEGQAIGRRRVRRVMHERDPARHPTEELCATYNRFKARPTGESQSPVRGRAPGSTEPRARR